MPISGIAIPVPRFLADQGYDSVRLSADLAEVFGPSVEIIIQTPKIAVPGLSERRDAHIQHISAHGLLAWQAETGHDDRAHVEAQIGRYKSVIWSELKS